MFAVQVTRRPRHHHLSCTEQSGRKKSDTFCSVHPSAAPLVTVSCASKRLVVQEALMGGPSSPKILYLKDFNAAVDQPQKKQEKFQAEPSPFRVSLFIAQLAAHCF